MKNIIKILILLTVFNTFAFSQRNGNGHGYGVGNNNASKQGQENGNGTDGNEGEGEGNNPDVAFPWGYYLMGVFTGVFIGLIFFTERNDR